MKFGFLVKMLHSNTTLVKVKLWPKTLIHNKMQIQIQHLLKLNLSIGKEQDVQCKNSNTTLVKVKFISSSYNVANSINSNTTLVKVKFYTIIPHFSGLVYSNTTLVKVKFAKCIDACIGHFYSNTTLVKVKSC